MAPSQLQNCCAGCEPFQSPLPIGERVRGLILPLPIGERVGERGLICYPCPAASPTPPTARASSAVSGTPPASRTSATPKASTTTPPPAYASSSTTASPESRFTPPRPRWG